MIASDPDVMGGEPVFAGTRIPVSLILEKLDAGESAEDILLDYPRLSLADIDDAVAKRGDSCR